MITGTILTSSVILDCGTTEVLLHHVPSKLEKAVIQITNPKGLRAIEIAAPLADKMEMSVMLQIDGIELPILESMTNQMLEYDTLRRLILLSYNEMDTEVFVPFFAGYLNYFKNLRIKMPHLSLCVAASDLFDPESNVSIAMKLLKKINMPFGLDVILSDGEGTRKLLSDPHFLALLDRHLDVTLFLMKIDTQADWDISQIVKLNKPIVFWSLAQYLKYKAVVIRPSVSSVIATATPNRDKVSVWSDSALKEKVLRKISTDSAPLDIVDIGHIGSKHVGRLHDGGYVDLKYFDVRMLLKN